MIRMKRYQKFIAWFLIPRGLYCDGCPFWSRDGGRPGQENGYCSYLGKGDWDINDEYPKQLEIQKSYPDGSCKQEMVDKEFLMPLSLLWDGCKECNKK